MHFASDNTGPTHPTVMAAVARANEGYAMPYGKDPWEAAATALIRKLFEAPQAQVFYVATGTAANALALGCLAPPWSTVFCHAQAHILIDESNAPQFYTGGAHLHGIEGAQGRISPDALHAAIAHYPLGDVHTPLPGALSLTNVTEAGTLYTVEDISTLNSIAKSHGLPTHLDGARFANACAALECSAAELSWKAGVDVLSFGGTKNGCMGVEAVIFFDPIHAQSFHRRRMRGGHLHSKHRSLSAQMEAFLTNDLWLRLGEQANGALSYLAQRLATLPHVAIESGGAANMLFARFPRRLHRAALDAGAQFYSWSNVDEGDPEEPIIARLVCDWSTSRTATDAFIAVLKE